MCCTDAVSDRDPAADHAAERIDPAVPPCRRPVNFAADMPQAPAAPADLGSAMTSSLLPDAGSRVELTAADEPSPASASVQTDGRG